MAAGVAETPTLRQSLMVDLGRVTVSASSESGTYRSVKARLWPCISGESTSNLVKAVDGRMVPNAELTAWRKPYTLHTTHFTLHTSHFTLHPSDCTPQTKHYTPTPTPYTLHPSPYTLHPTPYTPHTAHCTLPPSPYTLQPKPQTLDPTPHEVSV